MVGGFHEGVGGEDSEVEFFGGASSDGGEVGADGVEGWVGGVADFAEGFEGSLALVRVAGEEQGGVEFLQCGEGFRGGEEF